MKLKLVLCLALVLSGAKVAALKKSGYAVKTVQEYH